jgi:hypothetical protein
MPPLIRLAEFKIKAGRLGNIHWRRVQNLSRSSTPLTFFGFSPEKPDF